MKNLTKSALIIIDMEKGFVEKESPFCIAGAEATLRNCKSVLDKAHDTGIPVFFVKRLYRENGIDVEGTRYDKWKNNGKAMQPGSRGFDSAEGAGELVPQNNDYTIVKPRWSAFFATELDLILRRLGVETIVLIGTTTPNCIRTTAYDGNALDYEVVVVEDCCSSQTQEIQKSNIEDMERMGVVIMNSFEFCKNYQGVKNKAKLIRENMADESLSSDVYEKTEKGNVVRNDLW